MGGFAFIIFSQLRRPIEPKFTGLLMYAYDGIHQVRILALTIFNSAFNLCLYKCVFPEENLGALCGLGFQSLPD